MKVSRVPLEEILVIEPRVFEDERGFFMETYRKDRYEKAGIRGPFVQDNFSHSVRGTLRGLHYQIRHPQAKLIQVLRGEILDVVVDIRGGSPAFGRWTSVALSEKNRRQLFVPEGFAHGFSVLSDFADVHYKCTDFYAPEDEGGVLWSDPSLGIDWRVMAPLVSPKDSGYPRLEDIPPDRLPTYQKR